VSDPVGGNVRIRRRRRGWRRGRHRSIRRWLATATIALCVGIVSAVALQHLSPSLFGPEQSVSSFQQAELSRKRLLALTQIFSQVQPPTQRPVYPYSVVPGGVQDAKELKWVAEHDPIVAAHYAGFDYDHAQVVRLTLARTVYVSYRIGNRVYWTSHRLTLHKGEKVITDGRITARTRCANRVEETPQQAAASPVEPPVAKFDQPVGAGDGTAMQSPPVPFQSALLERPQVPGVGPAGPLNLYSPFVGGSWVSVATPPLPLDVCGPVNKKDGVETGCCAGELTKKKGSPCGSPPGMVPEPGTWVMFVSGLAAIYWQTRRKLIRN
jgi:hypothetical protein